MFLHLDNISYSYLGSGCVLFSDLSLSFDEGWTVIAGANGSGKSTLISIAAGLISPDSGSVRKSGEAILCPQVFDGLMPEDWIDIFSGSNHVGMLKSTLALTDGMIEREETLSGGESQRVKLATELSKKSTGKTVYILDEPTTGLHFEDIRVLLDVLNRLVDKGNTVIVIEHNLDVIKSADYVIDMGPDGGRNGGQVLFTGTPEALANSGVGCTAPFLKEELRGQGNK